MNVLLLSCGTRNKLIQYFKKNIGQGKVIAADISSIAPAIYEADGFYLVPRITDPGYIDAVLAICRREQITGVLSLIDPELSLLAANQERFARIGVTVIGSAYDLCERALDKMQMYRWLREHGYPCARSYDSIESFFRDEAAGILSFPVFVKPIRGSASTAVSKVCHREMAEFLFSQQDGLMLQEYLEGQEIGADVYVDLLSGKVVSIFTKKKLAMRAGETDKSVSFKDPALFSLIERFVNESGFRGQIDIDLFQVRGEYYISEVNPRFGGGYPHAHECGCDHIAMILRNLQGLVNEKQIGCYDEGIYMMKYNDVCIRRMET